MLSMVLAVTKCIDERKERSKTWKQELPALGTSTLAPLNGVET